MMYSYAIFTDSIVGEKTIELTYMPERTKEFKYTGNYEEYEVPNSGYYYIELGGAGEENIYGYGQGAITSGYIKLEKGDKLYFYVGGKHNEFNGGGHSDIAEHIGNGATDVRLESGKWDNINSLLSRIMVAGAGGNQSNHELGKVAGKGTIIGNNGNGGTLYGIKGKYLYNSEYGTVREGNEGTQTVGGSGGVSGYSTLSTGGDGSFGKGGFGGASVNNAMTEIKQNYSGYGGSGGYYGSGGSAGRREDYWSAISTSGGSSYISGYAGVNSVAYNTTITHTNDTLHYSEKYFIGGEMLEGQNSGNGYAKITYVGEKPKRKDDKLDNVRYIKNCIHANSANNGNHWVEIQAIKDGKNIAKGKAITGTSSPFGEGYKYENAVDGILDYSITPEASYGGTSGTNKECVTVDLGEFYDLDEVAVWNSFVPSEFSRVYYEDKTYVSSDNSSDESSWKEVINEASIETSNGHRVNAYRDHLNGYVQDGLVLWYDGYANTGKTRNFTTTTWKDLSGNNNDLTISGDPTWNGNNLQFNGAGYAYKTTVDYKINDNEYTLEVIVMPTSKTSGDTTEPNYQKIFSSHPNGLWADQYLSIVLHGQNSLFAYSTADGTNVKTIYSNYPETDFNKIQSLNSNLKDNSLYAYRNGTLATSSKIDFIPQITTSGVYVGGGIHTRPIYTTFIGKIYSIRVYNKALTEEELVRNYEFDKLKYGLE